MFLILDECVSSQAAFFSIWLRETSLEFLSKLEEHLIKPMFTFIWLVFIHVCIPLRTCAHGISSLSSNARGSFAVFLENEVFCCPVKQHALIEDHYKLSHILQQHAIYQSRSCKSERKTYCCFFKTEVMLFHSLIQMLSL